MENNTINLDSLKECNKDCDITGLSCKSYYDEASYNRNKNAKVWYGLFIYCAIGFGAIALKTTYQAYNVLTSISNIKTNDIEGKIKQFVIPVVVTILIWSLFIFFVYKITTNKKRIQEHAIFIENSKKNSKPCKSQQSITGGRYVLSS